MATATATTTATRSDISLRGSVEIVTEFFGYAINNVLYQRGIYPPERFQPLPKYGLSILVTTDEAVKGYLVQVLRQVSGEFGRDAGWRAGAVGDAPVSRVGR